MVLLKRFVNEDLHRRRLAMNEDRYALPDDGYAVATMPNGFGAPVRQGDFPVGPSRASSSIDQSSASSARSAAPGEPRVSDNSFEPRIDSPFLPGTQRLHCASPLATRV